ncbi:MAG TPA: M20 family metallopeptidase [Hyphomicrobiaceae bacterium]|nr:M20 family metallopeptidase [Hyphomicrobiaceae bacterium]
MPKAATSPAEQRVLDWLARHEREMIGLIEEVVNIDSGSYDKAGVDRVGERFIRFFEGRGMIARREAHASFGDAIHVRLDDTPTNERPVVLMGHRDTVFPKGEAGRRPFRIEGGRAYGPGVSDMKAGLVMNAFVLAAFKELGGAPAPLAGLITSDEEIASPSSRPVIERVAREARCVFNSEPGRPTGAVVTGRKGGVFMRMVIEGRAAHSGGNFEYGISAIGELAHKIVAIHALTDLKRGVTLNVGLVKGGQSVNTTAPEAEAQIDFRYVTPKDRAEILARLEAIVAASTVPGTKATLTISGEFLPLNATPSSEELFGGYKAASADLGLTVAGEFTGGCADSGYTAGVGCPTLCAVGPVGGKAHTAEEYLEVASIVPRAQALALAILRLSPDKR